MDIIIVILWNNHRMIGNNIYIWLENSTNVHDNIFLVYNHLKNILTKEYYILFTNRYISCIVIYNYMQEMYLFGIIYNLTLLKQTIFLSKVCGPKIIVVEFPNHI
jgi:hypothetical protein